MDTSLVVGLIMFGMAIGAMLTYLNLRREIRPVLRAGNSKDETERQSGHRGLVCR